MAHRALTGDDIKYNDIFESLLDRPRELLSLLPQEESPTHGEGLDQGLAFVLVKALVEEATADRIELLSGRGNELTKLGRRPPPSVVCESKMGAPSRDVGKFVGSFGAAASVRGASRYRLDRSAPVACRDVLFWRT